MKCFKLVRSDNTVKTKMAASYSVHGFPRLFSGTKCVLGCFKSTPQFSLHRKVQYNCLTQYRKCSTLQDDRSGDEDAYSKFEKMMRERRRQINKSVLVRVFSKNVIMNLYNHCQKYGNISRAFHYSLENDKNFALIEFESKESFQNFITDARHFDRKNVIPVHSHCLLYHEAEQSKENALPLELMETGPPTEDDIVHVLQNAQSVSEQMTSLHELLRLPELGQLLRFFVCHQLELAFSGLFTKCTVLPFGSCVNGFGKFSCDLDMVLSMGDPTLYANSSSKLFFHTKCSLPDNRIQVQRHLETISDVISNYFPGCTNIQKILLARVPIIKFRHEFVNTECDLTMNNLSGVYMAELLYLYGEFDDRVRPLVFTILKWAKQNGLTQDVPGRWITNFSLILMVLVFLQSRPSPIIPSLDTLHKLSGEEHQRLTEGVNCSFLRDVSKFPKTDNTNNQGDLLQEFFYYYANFDFKARGLSLNTGFDVIKPEHCPLYIQNPFESKLNVCKNVNASEMERIQERFETALWKLESSSRQNAGSSWGLLDLFNVQGLNQGDKFKRIPVSALFDKNSPNYVDSQKVEILRNGAMMDAAEIADSDRRNLPSRNKKSQNNTKKDLVNQLKLERFLQNAFMAANTKNVEPESLSRKLKRKKSDKRTARTKPWTF